MVNTQSIKEIISDWVHQYNDDLYRYAIHKMPNDELAEDMVQNTFLAAFKSYGSFKHESAPKTWLMSILKNKIMDHYRSSYRKNEQRLDTDITMHDVNGNWLDNELPNAWETEHVLDNQDFRIVFANCLGALPEAWNHAIHIKYLDSKLTPESLGISRTNYWKMLERARRQLRKCLESNWFKQNN